ncbi:rhodanese-like domain-containing protein [Synoicihabitans lomoniglobus]|uniref:Rhodanese-like domain-containing protein n=1 Tax=Synoicihabitans lomoniglobus TaxID=2909285 RepID=A0AAE9ZWU2_9BACT|nr:rhodanese-like domain-containing protein [Opitutaceae bacterium LMO-M01]WED63968.1 rhodanese-like domain-containing protein [Opitutaceae bacterium LMO-M01]
MIFRRAVLQALGLLTLAVPPAALSYLGQRANSAAPHAVTNLAALPRYHLSLAEARALAAVESGSLLWIDARHRTAYADAHFPTAINLPVADWDAALPELLAHWTPSRPIIVYCSSASCDAADQVARRLRRELGAENVWVLHDGWQALRDFNLP